MRTITSFIAALALFGNLAHAADAPKPAGSPAPSPSAGASPAPVADTGQQLDQNFREKLSESIQKTEKSIKILRQQIIESQNAPFLPDLYVQLADLLSQKALTLYYVQMERDGKVDTGPTKVQEAQPVVQATKEAVEVYKTVLHDFPKYSKRSEVEYKLALSLKSIDDVPQFIGVASRLIKEYPGTEDAMRASLLLGRHFLDEHEFDAAFTVLQSPARTKYTYEKNLARYWIGLVYLGREKFPEALHEFEGVVLDPELKEQENPYDLKKAGGHGKTDLKREALIDSIMAYTHVYEKNPDPVGYYSKLCPSEAYFQEVTEKLAIRYVVLKKYDQSVHLLRVVSERTADPQKVINVYREVLLMIPLQQRISIPVEEMRYVLQKFAVWQAYFDINQKALTDSFWYFEKQVRDLGTRTHDLAKTEKDKVKKRRYLEISEDYYQLYLAYFERTPNAVKIAMDLADVYYLLGEYYHSGDYYLRVFQGEFGQTTSKKAVIENAILALQKDSSEAFYDKVRAKGLLIKAVQSYQAMSPSLKNDPRLQLLVLKSQYEQGYLPETLDQLYEFMKTHKSTKEAFDAGDLILDYFNTRNDFQGLQFWSDKLLFLKLPNSAYNAKLERMKVQAKGRVVQDKVKSVAGYDEFSADDNGTQSAEIQEALAKSKREHDLSTFLQAAAFLAKKETNPQKRAAILRSIAQENMKVGRFYAGIAELKDAMTDHALDSKTHSDLLGDELNLGVMLHDAATVQEGMSDSVSDHVSDSTRSRVREQISDALDSPVDLNAGEVNVLFKMGLSDESLLALFKAKRKLNGSIANRVQNEVRSRCGSESRQAVCLWASFEQLESVRAATLSYLRRAPTELKSLEGVASQFMETVRKYQTLEGGADPHLETAISIRGRELYNGFAEYLGRVANANPDLRNDLIQKARESQASGQVYLQKCEMLAKRAAINPALRYCSSTRVPSLDTMLSWESGWAAGASRSDPSSAEVEAMQKEIFSTATDAEPMLKLSSYYLKNHYYYHAAALAGYGVGTHKEREGDFRAVLGCSLLRLGYLGEAGYHLRTATDFQGLKTECSRVLQGMRAQVQ
jgi:hypothetical protein